MNIGRILFIAILIFSATTLLTVSSALEAAKNSNLLPQSLEDELNNQLRQADLEKNYQENLLSVLNAFTVKGTPLTGEQENILENQLLALTVPASFRDLHFKLVAALASLKSNDESVIKTTRQKLQELFNEYSWLSSKLSLFIMNNF